MDSAIFDSKERFPICSEKVKSILCYLTMEDKDIVFLNVGGCVYTTTVGTLRSELDSMLAAMFSGAWKLTTVHKIHNHRNI